MPRQLQRTTRRPDISKDTPGTELIFEFCHAFDVGDLVTDATSPRARRILEELRNRLIETIGPGYVATDEALRLKRKAGAPQKTDLHADLAFAVFDLMHSQPRVGKDIAIARVAGSRQGISESVIRHAYETLRPAIAKIRAIAPAQAPGIAPPKIGVKKRMRD